MLQSQTLLFETLLVEAMHKLFQHLVMECLRVTDFVDRKSDHLNHSRTGKSQGTNGKVQRKSQGTITVTFLSEKMSMD